MKKRDIAACVVVDAVNIRYATDSRNMQVFMSRNPARYVFIPLEGPVVLFEFEGCHHLSRGLETIDEIRPAITVSYVASGPHVYEKAKQWKAWPIPDAFVKNRYFVLAHGVGMTGEYPYIMHRQDFEAHGYDGVIEPNMTLCIETYIGTEGDSEDESEGVKLEQQVLVIETGIELLSHFPFEEDLLGREV